MKTFLVRQYWKQYQTKLTIVQADSPDMARKAAGAPPDNLRARTICEELSMNKPHIVWKGCEVPQGWRSAA